MMTKTAISLVLCTLLSPLMASDAEKPAVEVEIIKFQFLPAEITIKQGDSVRWINREKRQYHSVWFEKAGDPEPDYIFPGEIYTRSFTKPGTFLYRCGPHPKMTALVHVK